MRNIRTNIQDDHPLRVGFVGRVDECRASLMPLVNKGQVEIFNYPNARSVLRLTSTKRNALWVIEIELADMSGLDLIEMIRDRLRDSTVCMIGPTYCQADEVRAYRAGATIYASRPLESAWLISCVELLLGDRKSHGAVSFTDSPSPKCLEQESIAARKYLPDYAALITAGNRHVSQMDRGYAFFTRTPTTRRNYV